jgi:hypothetical protein
VAAAVAELDRGLGAAAMDRFRKPRERRQKTVVINAELTAAMAPGALRRRHLRRDEPDAPRARAK